MNKTVMAGIGGAVVAIVAIAIVASGLGVSDDGAPADLVDNVGQDSVVQSDKIKVFASFYPYYEFTKNIAGDYAVVEQYLPSGVEAHDWEPRALEIQSLKDADVFVYNGLGIESYVDNLIDSGEFDHVLFVKASESVELIRPVGDDDTHAEEFIEEIEHVIEEFEHGHVTESQALEQIEEILHEHEGDGHDHGNNTIEGIEELLHEVEEGHLDTAEGIEEIHHFISEIAMDEHGDERDEHGDERDEHGDERDEHGDERDEHGDERDEHGDHHGHDHDFEFDPHIWLDPILAKQQVNNIRDGLIDADPTNREHYEQNAMAYNAELDALDMNIQSSLSSCAKDTFVPFHNAFTYLAQRYDLQVMPLSGLAPESEASAAEIAEFVDFVRDNEIQVIFSEELVDPRLAEVIADEAGARVILFSPLEALAPDEIGQGITYIDKMEKNLQAMRIALECQ